MSFKILKYYVNIDYSKFKIFDTTFFDRGTKMYLYLSDFSELHVKNHCRKRI